MSIKGFHLCLPRERRPTGVLHIIPKPLYWVKYYSADFTLESYIDLYNYNIFSPHLFTLIPLERMHDSMLPMTIRQPYSMNNVY